MQPSGVRGKGRENPTSVRLLRARAFGIAHKILAEELRRLIGREDRDRFVKMRERAAEVLGSEKFVSSEQLNQAIQAGLEELYYGK